MKRNSMKRGYDDNRNYPLSTYNDTRRSDRDFNNYTRSSQFYDEFIDDSPNQYNEHMTTQFEDDYDDRMHQKRRSHDQYNELDERDGYMNDEEVTDRNGDRRRTRNRSAEDDFSNRDNYQESRMGNRYNENDLGDYQKRRERNSWPEDRHARDERYGNNVHQHRNNRRTIRDEDIIHVGNGGGPPELSRRAFGANGEWHEKDPNRRNLYGNEENNDRRNRKKNYPPY
ncbi:hypothetical protein LX64_00309 [Chitinophaga skermanii]|uniref:Uncharacterized protein n=1 Tax=Chitinophaga skermanii TaxID=331697 RepID=A0A327R4P8_9BACT|nr:hypothetical protein [Chitinophaga skermanii]RAJ10703.1 hypothetical protein LX64_00309 [Chitinophaga skermanii]